MDVTSLLNNGAAAESVQKKMEEPRIPGRNRTPWDAGGYALPLNTRQPTSPTWQQQQRRQSEEGQTSAPSSPRHGFSDSRSSLSSYASSVYSANHSRFSSMSTVGGPNSLNTITSEMFSPKSMLSPSGLYSSNGTINEPNPFNTQSLSENLEALATISEHRYSPDSEQTSTHPSPRGHKEPNVIIEYPRPSSPSDAILIRRTTVPSLRLDTGGQEITQDDFQRQLKSNYLSAPVDRHAESLLKSHKRSASAPDFQAAMSDFAFRPVGPATEPTPPSSYHPDNASPTPPFTFPAPDTPPVIEEPIADVVVCMYIPNCDTGSQPRKAISHIFGRNKMCTRLIPDHVWVHYCRKHYQRSRYRNPKEYAKLQCDLVQQQIRRIQEWSKANQIASRPGTVSNWGLSLRKREQQRLENLSGKRKRSISIAGFDHDSEGDNIGDESNESPGGNGVPATAVPKWILDKMGKGYDTNEILAIFNRLHHEILSDELPCFPDIEILPNISVDDAERNTKEVKGYAKRNTSAHKRSRSLGVIAKSEYYTPGPSDRRQSQPGFWPPGSPGAQKRRRQGEFDEGTPVPPNNTFPRRMQLAHRPVFAHIQEHQMAEDDYSQSRMSRRHVTPPQMYQAPLLAPTPQRYGSQSMAAHLEVEHAQTSHRGRHHQRSQSDMSAFVQPRYSVSPSYPVNIPFSGNGAAPINGSYFTAMHHVQQPVQGQQYASQQQMHPFTQQCRPSVGPVVGHARHQSAGMVSSLYGRQGHPVSTMPPNDMRHDTPMYEAQHMRGVYTARH